MALEREGVAFGRYVQYAILLDRLLRFPITGARVRNYDGLGGQLLFAFLHQGGYLHWADNQLTIDWERAGEAVTALREQIEDLYRAGIDRTKLQALGRRPRPDQRQRPAGVGLPLGGALTRPSRAPGPAPVRRPGA